MALRGTLSDFGIADIFQLVGHQAKTGVLLLKNRELEVRISFYEGNVVRATQSVRDKADLLGNIMVRAGVLEESQLEAALLDQQRTQRRLGDVLVDAGHLDLETLRDFTRLQTTETIYRLFLWETGTYEFTQDESVDFDERTQTPIRAEEILMEAFRMVDEWPSVREVVPSALMVLRQLKPLPEEGKASGGDDDDLLAGLDDVFGAIEAGETPDEPNFDADIGPNERRVFQMITPNMTVQTLIDISRLGEFETTKAAANLVRGGFVHGHLDRKIERQAEDGPFSVRRLVEALPAFATRVVLYLVVAAAVGGLIKLHELDEGGLLDRNRALIVRPGQVQQQLGAVQKQKLIRAIEVHRLSMGTYPETLQVLVDEGLVSEDDLRRPFRSPYSYRRTDRGYALALPLR